MSDETRVFARSSAPTKRQQRAAKRAKRVNWRARLALRRMEAKQGKIAAVEKMLEEEAKARAREHRRPAPQQTPLDALLPKLTEPQVRAAARIMELYERGAIISRKVTAAYGSASRGNDEMTDGAARAWGELTQCYRALHVEEWTAVHGLVCHGEQRDPVLVLRGLSVAAAHWGY